MLENIRSDLEFFSQQSKISHPGKHNVLLDGLPTNINALCDIIQGILIHAFWISEENYGVSIESLKTNRDLNEEYNLRSVEEILSAVISLDSRSLQESRPASMRVVGNCRDFALMLTSFLRHQGIPARVRSGVARYFYTNGHLEDHFITEWWYRDKHRWQYTDPQIDQRMRDVCGIALDVTDLPRNQFLHAGVGYAELVEGRVSPDKIGIFDYRGLPYVRYKLVSDLACLNKVEVLAWEGWGIMSDTGNPELNSDDLALLDCIAGLLIKYDNEESILTKIQDLFTTHPRLNIPEDYVPEFWEFPPFNST